MLLERIGRQKQKTPQAQGFTGFSFYYAYCPTRLSIGAQERTRTSTVLPPLGPEPSASTNSATWAGACAAKNAIIAGCIALSSISQPKLKWGSEPLPIWLLRRCGP